MRSIWFWVQTKLNAAKHLVNGTSVTVQEGGVVAYIHLLFAHHEVVFSNGVPSESYFPEHALTVADRNARTELDILFPDFDRTQTAIRQTAHVVSRRRETQLMAMCA